MKPGVLVAMVVGLFIGASGYGIIAAMFGGAIVGYIFDKLVAA